MQVETYEQVETDADLQTEDLSSPEALALIEQLNLAGQRSLLTERDAGGDTVITRNPYRLMSAEEKAVYQTLFPNSCDIREYSNGPIPLRVMQVAAHAESCIKDVELQVWYPRDSTIRDPLLVGQVRENYNAKFYILARWGEALEDLQTLKEKARTVLQTSIARQIRNMEADMEKIRSTQATVIDDYLEGGQARFPYLGNISMSAG